MEQFPITDKTRISRLAKRGVYEKEAVHAILDEALFCTIAYAHDGQAFQIPTGFCRIDNKLYIHGSVGSHFLRTMLAEDRGVCISVMLVDGLVLARSAMHHSVNYRSVILFSKPTRVTDKEEQYRALEIFTNKVQPGRWDDVRQPTDNEWKETMILSFEIDEASAKVRTGGPKDDEEDYALDVWAGVVPLQTSRLAPVPDELLREEVTLPDYLR